MSGRLILDRPWFPFEPWALPFTRPLIGYGPEIYSYVYPLGMDTEALNQTHRVPQYAHNYLIHQTVELGYLGLASYLFILAAFFLPATVALIRNRRLDSQGQKVVLLALVAALAGRSVEQMVGIPHAGDLTVFWALLGVFVALPSALGKSSDSPPAGAARTGQGRTRLRLWRLCAAAAVVVALATLVWTKNVSYVLADMAAASSRDYASRDPGSSLRLMSKATNLAPDVAFYHQARADTRVAERGSRRPRGESKAGRRDILGAGPGSADGPAVTGQQATARQRRDGAGLHWVRR